MTSHELKSGDMVSEDKVKKGLKGFSVLVTRPAHQAESLCQLIESHSGRAIRFPVIEIGPVDEQAGKQALQAQLASLADCEMAIFISPNAVSQTKAILAAEFPKQCQIAVVGQGTARQLKQDFGREPDVIPAQGFNSEALLAMPALQQVSGKQIMILRGDGGRALLGKTLLERGARVIYASVYKRYQPAADLSLLEQPIDIIVLTSGDGIRNLWDMAGETYRTWLCNMPILIINPRLQKIAVDVGLQGETVLADSADDKAILNSLQSWASQKLSRQN